MTSSLVFDSAAALERLEGDRALFGELLGIFDSDFHNTFGAIEAALAAKDWHALSRAAHAIKGALGNVGAMTSFDLALRLEKTAKDPAQVNNCGQLVTQLKLEITKFREASKEYQTKA